MSIGTAHVQKLMQLHELFDVDLEVLEKFLLNQKPLHSSIQLEKLLTRSHPNSLLDWPAYFQF